MKSEISKILGSIFIIGIMLMGIDWVFGRVADHFFIGSRVSKVEYCMSGGVDADLVVLGSSRAHHHYDTKFITDSLHIQAFNAGFDGRGLTAHLCLLQAIYENATPRIVVLELLPDDLSGTLNNRVDLLKRYYRVNDEVRSVMNMVDSSNKLLTYFSLYRYNSELLKSVEEYMFPYTNADDGYAPLDAVYDENLVVTPQILDDRVDPVALSCLEQIVELAEEHGTELVVVISPELFERVESSPVEEYCSIYGVPFIDNSALPEFRMHTEWFNDAWHMNRTGARYYTELFISQLQKLDLI